MKEIKLNVKGMVCAGCENRVKRVLGDIDGVEKVEANHTTCCVKVVLSEDIGQEEIEQKISDLGYEVVKEK